MRKRNLMTMGAALVLGASLLAGCGSKTSTETTAASTAAAESDTEAAEETAAAEESDIAAEAETADPTGSSGKLAGARAMAEFQDFDAESTESKVGTTMHYQTLVLKDEAKEKYPALNETLEAAADAKATEMATSYKSLQESAAEMEEYAEDGISLSMEDSLELRRGDDKVLSVLEMYSEYSGGAHGYTVYKGQSYDVQTGQELKLADLIQDKDALLSYLAEQLIASYPDVTFFTDNGEDADAASLTETLKTAYADLSNLSFVVDMEGLTFFFSEEELAPHACGMQQAGISFTGNSDLLTEQGKALAGE